MSDIEHDSEGVVRVTIAADPPPRLDKALMRDLPEDAGITRSALARLIAAGAVTRGGVVLEAKAKVAEGDGIDIGVPPAVEVEAGPEDIPLAVVFEDGDLIVVDKPAGLVVHPAPGQWTGTLVNALLHHCGDTLVGVGGAKRPGIVHRIDKDTTGLLVAAKTDRAHQGLSAQFAAHSVDRRYLAVVHGLPHPADPRLRGIRGVGVEPGGIVRVATGIGRHRTDRQRQAVQWDGGRAAVTRFRVIEGFGQPPVAALVECWLETGRTHQIRVHLAHAGHGLVGDPVYGGARKVAPRAVGAAAAAMAAAFPRQALHAATLGFEHPVTGARLSFASDLPADMAALLAALRAGA